MHRIQGSLNPRIQGSLDPRIQGSLDPRIQESLGQRIKGSLSRRIQGSLNPKYDGKKPCFIYSLIFQNSRIKIGILSMLIHNMGEVFTLSWDNFSNKCPKLFKELWRDRDMSAKQVHKGIWNHLWMPRLKLTTRICKLQKQKRLKQEI